MEWTSCSVGRIMIVLSVELCGVQSWNTSRWRIIFDCEDDNCDADWGSQNKYSMDPGLVYGPITARQATIDNAPPSLVTLYNLTRLTFNIYFLKNCKVQSAAGRSQGGVKKVIYKRRGGYTLHSRNLIHRMARSKPWQNCVIIKILKSWFTFSLLSSGGRF